MFCLYVATNGGYQYDYTGEIGENFTTDYQLRHLDATSKIQCLLYSAQLKKEDVHFHISATHTSRTRISVFCATDQYFGYFAFHQQCGDADVQ